MQTDLGFNMEKGVQAMKFLQWILVIAAALSMVIGVIFKLFRVSVLGAYPVSFIRFTVACCLLSIALGVISLSSKIKSS
jgi:hypothetical protein